MNEKVNKGLGLGWLKTCAALGDGKKEERRGGDSGGGRTRRRPSYHLL